MATTRSRTLTVCRASAGTGKTYTLAATYVALLFSGESYRSILAVTFTNKATQEMKDRILLFLDNIARNTGEDAENALKAVRSHMIRNTDLSDEKLRQMSAKLYSTILEDYDNLHISTIDTFLMQLLNGLGQMLDNATAGARVELNIDQVIAKAVDNLLTNPLDLLDNLLKRLAHYVSGKLDEGNSWDVRGALKTIAKNMYDESVQQMDADGQIVFDANQIIRYRNSLDYRVADCYKQLCNLYEPWRNWTPETDGINGLANVGKLVAEIGTYLDGGCKEEHMFRGYSEALGAKIEGDDLLSKYKYSDRGNLVREALIELNNLCKACKRVYLTQKATNQLLGDMALMADIRKEIRAILAEQNSVLLAQTADTLHRAMIKGDADFILEKVGIRYNHIMLDEFQDTSVLQWQNFKPLLEEILANGGTVFIVGDIKQSIYRWRNGDWTIMRDLNKDTPYLGAFFNDKSLNRNFRSHKQIVEFNCEVFQALAEQGYIMDVDSSSYSPSNDGGYVQMQLVPYKDEQHIRPKIGDAKDYILDQVFQTIAQRLALGERPSDMLLLVRTHAEAQYIVDFYRSFALENSILQNVSIVSCDSFQLDTSISVMCIIHALRWLFKQDEVSLAYLRLTQPQMDIEKLNIVNKKTPLCELLEEVIKLFPSTKLQDLAYINCLLDSAHDYVMSYDSSVETFLDYWDDTLHKVSISAPQIDAIRIMTVHTAKGLEAPNVFIPFCHWKLEKDKGYLWCDAKGLRKQQVEPLKKIPVEMKKDLLDSEYEPEMEKEHLNQQIDNVNALYVALTRARTRLYIYGAYQPSDVEKTSTVAVLLYNIFANRWTETDNTLFLSMENVSTEEKHQSKGKMQDRFSFAQAITQMAELHVGERPIAFQLSRESLDCLRYGVQEGEETFSRIDLGNVCHSIMEHITTREDEEAAITDAQMNGLISDETALERIRQLIDAAWENEQLCDWFSGKWELWREVTFLTANREMRPDRVMIDKNTSTAIVLDYKFGQHHDPKYPMQVQDYMRIMVQLGYKNVEGYLWFAQDNELQSVKLK